MTAINTSGSILPPPAPLRGMKFWVQWGTHCCLGTGHSITRVNSRSFYVATQGRCERYLHAQWSQWLLARFAQGTVSLDGQPLQAPPALKPRGEDEMAATQITVDIHARDQRFLRAARKVLRQYQIKRQPEQGGVVRFAVTGGDHDYQVELRPDWSRQPRCSCPDASHDARDRCAGFCKHIIATLVAHEDLQFQLLDLLL